jgi:molybdate-binding protein/DNA-binding transcriptional regulator YhcF (GntR family)
MDETYLYRRIAEEIRQDILNGRLQPGDRLPSIRELTRRWNCTPGTVQRAYTELAQQELIISQAGKGTHVSSRLDPQRLQMQAPLRRAGMVHRAESFLLESLTAGYSLEDVRQSVDLAMDRWRSLQSETPAADRSHLRFSGSHDMAVIWLSNHMPEIAAGVSLEMNFTGSLGGLMALAEGKCDLAGTHLWDAASGVNNEPFMSKLFPGKKMVLVRLANRRIGMIVSPGNPLALHRLEDLAHPGVRFINRQSGSGTRVWLDETLHRLGIHSGQIEGYAREASTHTEAARTIAEGQADAGIGLESAAAVYGLDFIPLIYECYDLAAYAGQAEKPPLKTLFDWLNSVHCREELAQLPGYDCTHTGQQKVLDL